MAKEALEKESIKEASYVVSNEFKTIVCAEDLQPLKQLKYTISIKSKILATYPDAFPDDSEGEVIDRRPDLEIPK